MKIGAQTPQQTMSQKARFNMYMLVESSLVRLGNKFKILRVMSRVCPHESTGPTCPTRKVVLYRDTVSVEPGSRPFCGSISVSKDTFWSYYMDRNRRFFPGSSRHRHTHVHARKALHWWSLRESDYYCLKIF